MNLFSWTLRIIAGSFLVVWLPIASFAFTPGAFIVSPAEVDLGTVRVLPGSSAGPYAFSIAVVGGPVADPAIATESADFYASCDATWLTLDPANGTAPGSITATAAVSETMGSGEWTANITILSGLDPGTDPVTIPVTITVVRSIGDLLTVSPSTLDLQMTDQNTSEQTFPITIANADPNKSTGFLWSARTDVSWLVLSTDEGSGNTTISLRVDPEAIYLNNDTDGDGIPDAAVGTITFRSSLNAEAVTLTVNATILSSAEPSVSPSQLYWTVEKSTASTALAFSSQRLQVFGFESGWTAASDMGFVSVACYDAAGEKASDLGSVIITDPYGWVAVTPDAELLSAMDYGTYVGYVTVSDLDKEVQIKIPITINIRKSGEAVYLPVVEFTNAYSQMEAAESSLINVQIPVPEDIAYYSTAATCQAAGGAWVDPDRTLLDSLDAYCSLNEHAYVLLERRDMEPGMVYAMTKTGTLALAYENGIKVSGADDLSYADGPVSYIPFGPLQMIGSYGTVVVSLRIGTSLSSAVEIQRLLISLQTLEGQWTVTEAYKGSSYVYDFAPLTIERIIDGQPGYTASWEDMPVSVSFGDGSNWLYQLSFEQEGGIYYTYQIQSLSGSHMSGQWRYTWRGASSDWETFEAQRPLWQLTFP
ncbi:BACON domain-containing protein [Desulfobacter sp.]|uniref:BACON domain-containing protein n=1 Tax=Desulfobacter sp. TaxID=2294 RepID=UPI003D125B60